MIKILSDKIKKILSKNQEENVEKKEEEKKKFRPSSRIKEKLIKMQMEEQGQHAGNGSIIGEQGSGIQREGLKDYVPLKEESSNSSLSDKELQNSACKELPKRESPDNSAAQTAYRSGIRKKLMEISRENTRTENEEKGAISGQTAAEERAEYEKQRGDTHSMQKHQNEQLMHEQPKSGVPGKKDGENPIGNVTKGIEEIVSPFKITKEALTKIMAYSRIMLGREKQYEKLQAKDKFKRYLLDTAFGILTSTGDDVIRKVYIYYDDIFNKIAEAEDIEKIMAKKAEKGEKIIGFFYNKSFPENKNINDEKRNHDIAIRKFLMKNMAREFAVKNSVYTKNELSSSEYRIVIEEKDGKKFLKAVPKNKEDITILFEAKMPEEAGRMLALYFKDDVKIKKAYSIEKQSYKRGKCFLLEIDKCMGRDFEMHISEYKDIPAKTFSERAVKSIEVIDSGEQLSLESICDSLLKDMDCYEEEGAQPYFEELVVASELRANAFIAKLGKTKEEKKAKEETKEEDAKGKTTERAAEVPSEAHQETPPLSSAGHIVTGTKHSRLYEKIKRAEQEKDREATGAKAHLQSSKNTSQETLPKEIPLTKAAPSTLYKKILKVTGQNEEKNEGQKAIAEEVSENISGKKSRLYEKLKKIGEQTPTESQTKIKDITDSSKIYETMKKAESEKIIKLERPSARVERMRKKIQMLEDTAAEAEKAGKAGKEENADKAVKAAPEGKKYAEELEKIKNEMKDSIDKYFGRKEQEFMEFADKYVSEQICSRISAYFNNYVSNLEKKINGIMELFERGIKRFGDLMNDSAPAKAGRDKADKSAQKTSDKTLEAMTAKEQPGKEADADSEFNGKGRSYGNGIDKKIEGKTGGKDEESAVGYAKPEEIAKSPDRRGKENCGKAEGVYGRECTCGNYRERIREFYNRHEKANKHFKGVDESHGDESHGIVAKIAKIVSGDYKADLEEMANGETHEDCSRKNLWRWDERLEGLKALYATGIYHRLEKEQSQEILKIAEILDGNRYVKRYRKQQYMEVKKILNEMAAGAGADEGKRESSDESSNASNALENAKALENAAEEGCV